MSVNFRDVEHKLCLVFDQRALVVFNKENDDKSADANCLVCYGYVDHTAGLTYEVLGLAKFADGRYECLSKERTVGFKIRADEGMNGVDVIPIQNEAIEELFKRDINIVEEGYYKNESVIEARNATIIDPMRHPSFPDDVLAILSKEGIKAESIWVRLEGYYGKHPTIKNPTHVYYGQLLNQPFDNGFGFSAGERVAVVVFHDGTEMRAFVIKDTIS